MLSGFMISLRRPPETIEMDNLFMVNNLVKNVSIF